MAKKYGISFEAIKSGTGKELTEFQKNKILEHKELIKESNKDTKVARMLLNKSQHAKAKGVFFSLTFADMEALYEATHCAYTGVEMMPTPDKSGTHKTIERVNPELGYVRGNVVAVTSESNSHKSQLDSFVKGSCIPDSMKVKLLRKALYQLEKGLKGLL